MPMAINKKIGFIGAGKVGFSLGRYFMEHHMDVSGYYSQNPLSAKEAAAFTQTAFFETLQDVVRESDVLFLTVPDSKIASVWNELKQHHIQGKIVCHCSGALSSDIFSNMESFQIYGYSIHPLFAIHDPYTSYKELSQCLFTIEGHEQYKDYFKSLFKQLGNPLQVIDKEDKVRYHLTATMASNLVVGLVHLCEQQLIQCGFAKENCTKALGPLLQFNIAHILSDGCEKALTGPLERCDCATVKKHLQAISGNEETIYKCLSKVLLAIAKNKNPERHYEEMEGILEE